MGKRIVIIGAGFGGLRTAMILGREVGKDHEIILIDKNHYHTFHALLYEAATTSQAVANHLDLHNVITYYVDDIVESRHVKFIKADVTDIDISEGDIHFLDRDSLKYDFLVVALGSESNFFDIPGLKENALEIKSFVNALEIRDSIAALLDGKEDIKIAVGGGGSTGVELSAEIQNWFNEIKMTRSKFNPVITLINADPTILSGYDKNVVRLVSKRLARLGVKTLDNETVTKVSPNLVSLKSGREVPYDVFIWAGGVKANSILQTMKLKLENKGRSEASNNLICIPEDPSLKIYGRIYGIGDAICARDASGNLTPMLVQPTLQQAKVAAKNIILELRGKEPKLIFKPFKNYPYIIPVGGKYAVGCVGPLVISGWPCWIAKGLVEINYLCSIMPPKKAFKIWLKGLMIFIQNDRLG
ncbi:MAG: FAD-dependent oxidoreductase [Patescibacteria group bacterium]